MDRYGDAAVTRSIKTFISCPHDDAGCCLAAELAELRERVRQLEASSRIDALTGFYNYRHLIEVLAAEMERTRRTGIPTALIMTDLDHFKNINDAYGHEAGNMALKQATRLWLGTIRQVDVACRYGGEEFVFILPGTRFAMALRAAERLRDTLAKTPLQLSEGPLTLTASFGVASYRSGESLSVADFIDRADQHVLAAKAAGRNRVAFDRSQLVGQETAVSASEKALLTRLKDTDADGTP
jgi:two-component system, cell cycle response regulator